MGFRFDQAQGVLDHHLRKTGRNPTSVVVSVDVMKEFKQEFQRMAAPGKGVTNPFAQMFLFEVPIKVDPYLAPGTMYVLNSRGQTAASVATSESVPEPDEPEFESIFK